MMDHLTEKLLEMRLYVWDLWNVVGTRAQFCIVHMTNGNFLRKKVKQILGMAKALQFVLLKVCLLIM